MIGNDTRVMPGASGTRFGRVFEATWDAPEGVCENTAVKKDSQASRAVIHTAVVLISVT